MGWGWLQNATALVVQYALATMGVKVLRIDDSCHFGNTVFLITPGCTFIDFALCLTPFFLRGRPWPLVPRLALSWVCILAGKIFRLTVWMYLLTRGVPVVWDHDVPTYGIWLASSLLCLFLWLGAGGSKLPCRQEPVGPPRSLVCSEYKKSF